MPLIPTMRLVLLALAPLALGAAMTVDTTLLRRCWRSTAVWCCWPLIDGLSPADDLLVVAREAPRRCCRSGARTW
jgi:hypothetical protein